MIMKIFNHTWLLSVLLAVGIMLLIYFLLKNKSKKTKTIVLFILMMTNVLQHLFKMYVWPHYYGQTFNRLNTLYNMCALLICFSPFTLLTKSNSLKAANFIIGSIAGLGATCYPYWFFDTNIITWEYLRFYFCHAMLFITSFSTLLLGLVEFKLKDFYKIGLWYYAAACILLINNMICSVMEVGLNIENVYRSMLGDNPCYFLGPPTNQLKALFYFVEKLSPEIFLGNDTRYYVPILWQFIPVYSFITILAFIIFSILDKNSFLHKKGKLK